MSVAHEGHEWSLHTRVCVGGSVPTYFLRRNHNFIIFRHLTRSCASLGSLQPVIFFLLLSANCFKFSLALSCKPRKPSACRAVGKPNFIFGNLNNCISILPEIVCAPIQDEKAEVGLPGVVCCPPIQAWDTHIGPPIFPNVCCLDLLVDCGVSTEWPVCCCLELPFSLRGRDLATVSGSHKFLPPLFECAELRKVFKPS
jgi:hypothetical protein